MLNFYVKMQLVKESVKETLKDRLNNQRGDIGLGTLISIAVAIIVAAFIMIPGMRAFGASVLASMNSWWQDSVRASIFPTA